MDRRRTRRAFTLVEILTTIVIIAMLMGFLLPAIQGVRETARRARCSNNLRQIASAALTHEKTQGFYPSGGWGWGWVGDADRGFGRGQPGGYLYSCLPYLEQQAVWALPADGDPNTITQTQRDRARDLVRTVLPTVNCPTRRRPRLFANSINGTYTGENSSPNSSSDNRVARADYAVNGGDQPTSAGNRSWIDWRGPASNIDLVNPWGDPESWPFMMKSGSVPMTGVASTCSEVKSSDLADGASLTYLVGERYINPGNYLDGQALHDCESWVQGTNNDMVRTGAEDFRNGKPVPCAPRPDGAGTPGVRQGWEHFPFGSAHAVSFGMAFADGSVRSIRYDISPAVHMSLCNRGDGAVIDGNAIR